MYYLCVMFPSVAIFFAIIAYNTSIESKCHVCFTQTLANRLLDGWPLRRVRRVASETCPAVLDRCFFF